MIKHDLALNNLEVLICHKTLPTDQIYQKLSSKSMVFVMFIFYKKHRQIIYISCGIVDSRYVFISFEKNFFHERTGPNLKKSVHLA